MAGYWLGICVFSHDANEFVLITHPGHYLFPLLIASLLLPIMASIIAVYWSINKWNHHPIATLLSHFAPSGCTWHYVTSSINIEFRRIDKFAAGPYGRRVFVTDSWIIMTSTYTIKLAHHIDDVHLSLISSEDHQLSHHSSTGTQLLSIQVLSLSRRVLPFVIRCVPYPIVYFFKGLVIKCSKYAVYYIIIKCFCLSNNFK